MNSFRERSCYWRIDSVKEAEFFKAHFRRHAYVRHTHDTFAIGVIESGVQTFRYRGAQRISPPLGLIVIQPGEVHDGTAHVAEGYRYRMIYVQPALIRRFAGTADTGDASLPFFPSPVVRDDGLARQYLAMHRLAETGARACAMEMQSRVLAFLSCLTHRHAEPRGTSAPLRPAAHRIRRAIDYMRHRLNHRVSLGEVSGYVGLSRYHFLRQFRAQTGMPPHAFLCQLRLEEAKRLMATGAPLAQVALNVGFYDQSHFTNRFRSTYGITPAEYGRAQRN